MATKTERASRFRFLAPLRGAPGEPESGVGHRSTVKAGKIAISRRQLLIAVAAAGGSTLTATVLYPRPEQEAAPEDKIIWIGHR